MRTTHDLLQQPSRADVCQTIPNTGEVFGGTGVAISGLLKFTRTYKNEKYHGTGCVSLSQDSQRKSGV